MSTFKVGDRVKIVKRLPGNASGSTLECYEPNGFVGRMGYVNYDHYSDSSAQVWSEKEGKGVYLGIFKPEELAFVSDQPLSIDWGFVQRPNSWFLIDEMSNYTWEPTKTNKKTLMTTVTSMMRNLLDPETQALIEAGFLGQDLELTSEGSGALDAIVFAQNKEALVKAAKAKLELAKKTK